MIFSLQAGLEQQLLSPQSVNPSGDIYYDDYDDYDGNNDDDDDDTYG